MLPATQGDTFSQARQTCATCTAQSGVVAAVAIIVQEVTAMKFTSLVAASALVLGLVPAAAQEMTEIAVSNAEAAPVHSFSKS